jgi:ABC-2 type transport system ATP-binding protein
MEHAERLCDRLVLIARGKKLFDGTVTAARALIPRRIRVQATNDPTGLRELPGVRSVEREKEEGRYEIVLAEGADPDQVLAACFQRGIGLKSFDRTEPGLRDVFIKLVGADGTEEVAA